MAKIKPQYNDLRSPETTEYPLASIGFAVYNGDKYLRQVLDSLLSQTYPNFVLIISDNASTDNTEAICREYAARDSRVEYHRQPENRGAVWNFNEVFRLSRGEFFMWAAHDDLWHQDYMARCIEGLQRDPKAVLCYDQSQPIDLNGNPVGETYSVVNTKKTMRDRWKRTIGQWDVYLAIYGVMRSEIVRKTQLIQPTLSSEVIFVGELSLYGTIIQTPQTLMWKRTATLSDHYDSVEAMVRYLGVPGRSSLSLQRLQTFRQALKTLDQAPISEGQRRRLKWDTRLIYLLRFYIVDLKEWVIRRIGSQNYQRWLRFKS